MGERAHSEGIGGGPLYSLQAHTAKRDSRTRSLARQSKWQGVLVFLS
jgi:hypothetical protein